MLSFILMLAFGLAISYFAGQNTLPVTISLAGASLPTVPLYTVIVGAMLIGFVVSWVVSLIDALFTTFVLNKKDSKIRLYQKKISFLEDKLHNFELENVRLKGESKRPVIQESHSDDFRPSIFNRFNHSIS